MDMQFFVVYINTQTPMGADNDFAIFDTIEKAQEELLKYFKSESEDLDFNVDSIEKRPFDFIIKKKQRDIIIKGYIRVKKLNRSGIDNYE